MDIPVHNQILWEACVLAGKRLDGKGIADPRVYFPLLCRGSWMNDTNQATIFTDEVLRQAPNVTEEMRRCFQGLWQLHASDLIDGMRRTVGNELADAARVEVDKALDVDEFGKYQRFDHLDIIKDDAPTLTSEYGDLGDELRARTVVEMQDFLRGRFRRNTVLSTGDERLKPGNITAIGRALHSVADFFAHTNYVELLLWKLAEDQKLDNVIGAFNAGSNAFERDHADFICPLPVGNVTAPKNRGILWYGPSATDTPLVSAVFDTDDTAYSLTKIYAAHLENPQVEAASAKQLAIILSIIDVPGRPLATAAWNIYKGFEKLLETIGTLAKDWLADRLTDFAKDAGAAKGAMESVAEIIRDYDLATASKWARAGKMRYVAHLVEERISKRLDDQSTGVRKLPHHTLISKDHPPHSAEGIARYGLACALATEATAELLEWHFSEKPADSPDRFERIARQWLRHPARQLNDAAGSAFSPNVDLGTLVTRSFCTPWQLLPARERLLVLR
ncbi:MAG: hypothetical protein JNK82_36770 [Myxococcaceae bacterium]|nr:hypothetical protein [Myxococcaceae bacterium]